MGRKTTASARAKSARGRLSWDGDDARVSNEGSRYVRVTPEPSSMLSHGVKSDVRGDPCLSLRWSNVSCTIPPHAARPPEEGLRRYQRPDPRTRREEGVEGAPESQRTVLVLFK